MFPYKISLYKMHLWAGVAVSRVCSLCSHISISGTALLCRVIVAGILGAALAGGALSFRKSFLFLFSLDFFPCVPPGEAGHGLFGLIKSPALAAVPARALGELSAQSRAWRRHSSSQTQQDKLPSCAWLGESGQLGKMEVTVLLIISKYINYIYMHYYYCYFIIWYYIVCYLYIVFLFLKSEF